MSFGHSSSEVYEVGLPNRQVILKINQDERALEGIQKNLEILTRAPQTKNRPKAALYYFKNSTQTLQLQQFA
jgi:predicted Ser/Thr protein kinase